VSWWWAARLGLALDIAALGVAALALTRRRTKSFFQAMANATESAEEP
jgi:hypothetical protein